MSRHLHFIRHKSSNNSNDGHGGDIGVAIPLSLLVPPLDNTRIFNTGPGI